MDWKVHEKKLLKDKEFLKEAKGLEVEYQLARSIIAQRIKKGLTQEALARKVKTKQSSISRLENALSKPSLSFLERVAVALNSRLTIKFEPLTS